jgi:iron complex outermembrane receptor protein
MKRSRREEIRRVAFGSCILGMSFWASSTLAQTQPAAADDDKDLDYVVVTGTRAVTATKTDTPILSIPQSINIITAEQIDDRGARTMVEALSYTAGVASGGDDSRGDFNIIRGFESVLYVDGLKRNFGFVYLPRADINALESVEVLVGPASVLYGPGSASGLTNMISKRPKFSSDALASLSYGSFDRKEAMVDLTGPLSDTFAYRFVGLVRESDSQIDFVPNDRVLIQPAFTWQPGENTEITAIGLYQRDKNGPNYNVVPLVASILAPPGRRLSDSVFLGEPGFNDAGHKQNTSLTLKADHKFSDVFSFHSSTRATEADTDQREVYPWVFSDPLNPFLDDNGNGTIEANETRVNRNVFAFDVDYETFNTDNNLEVNFSTGPVSHKVLVGVDYSRFEQVARQAFGPSTPIDIYNPVYGGTPALDYFPESTQIIKQLGIYVQNQVDFGKRASLVLGVRNDDYTKDENNPFNADYPAFSKEEANETTVRAGLTYNLTPTLAPYISYSESFLPISGLNQFGGSYSPLTAEQQEIGVKWQPLKATLLRVSYYDITENNSLRTDPDNPLNSIQTGYTDASGFEFQADHNVARDMTITASYSHSMVRQSGVGRQLDNSPRYLAALFGTKTLELRDDMTLRLGGGVRYVGDQTAGDAAFLQIVTPSYTVVDAMAALDYRNWAFKLNVLNLTDQHYYPTCYNYGFCANGLGRTLDATVAYRF